MGIRERNKGPNQTIGVLLYVSESCVTLIKMIYFSSVLIYFAIPHLPKVSISKSIIEVTYFYGLHLLSYLRDVYSVVDVKKMFKFSLDLEARVHTLE